MAGKLFPLVMLPRLTTLVGASTFRTPGVDVSAFEQAYVHVWRDDLRGTSPTILVGFEESEDQDVWTDVDGGDPFVPTANAETTVELTLARRYLRAVVTLSGTDVAATLFAVGHLVSRTLRRRDDTLVPA